MKITIATVLEVNETDDPKPINRTILETLAIAFTIAGAIWAIVYAILTDLESSMAMRESLEIFGFFFFLILIIYLIKK